MYTTCPQCKTKFVVPIEQIGEKGRKVKCSKCAHIWHFEAPKQIIPEIQSEIQSTPSNNLDSAALSDAPKGIINLPMLLPIRIQSYLYTLPILMIGLIIFMLVMIFPKSLGVNTFLGNNNLSVKDINIQNQPELEKITVSYKIHNSADKIVKMPLIRIRLFDKHNRIVKSLVDDHTNIDMAPNQFIQIKTEFVPAPKSTDSIDIMIGNKIDFILR